MDVKEIDAKIAELQALRVEAEKAELVREHQARYDEAVLLFPELLRILNRLTELGYLPQRLADVLTDSDKKVRPGVFIKRPRAVTKQHG